MYDWDDLRIFMAAARAGSFTAAAAGLGIDAATVSRRVARLETALKSTLAIRSASGLQLTAVGARLMESGQEVEAAMDLAARSGEPEVVGGTVRISVAEGFGATILAPALPALRAARPSVRIEMAANAGFLSPSRREVDMAVTLSAPDAARLVVEPLTDYQLGLYASQAYLDRAGLPGSVAALSGFELVGYVDDLIYAPELRYLDELHPSLRPSIASSSIQAQREILLAGGGIGVLPCFMASGLSQVLAGTVLITRRFWMSTHKDVTETARVRAVRDWLRDLVRVRRGVLAPFPIPITAS